jgi:hypothetical protein
MEEKIKPSFQEQSYGNGGINRGNIRCMSRWIMNEWKKEWMNEWNYVVEIYNYLWTYLTMLSHHTRNCHSKNGTVVRGVFSSHAKWYRQRSTQTSVCPSHLAHKRRTSQDWRCVKRTVAVNTDEQLWAVRTESKCACCVDGPVS